MAFWGGRKGATLLLSINWYRSSHPGSKAQTTVQLCGGAQVQRWAASGKSSSIFFLERACYPQTAPDFWKAILVSISVPWHCTSALYGSKHTSMGHGWFHASPGVVASHLPEVTQWHTYSFSHKSERSDHQVWSAEVFDSHHLLRQYRYLLSHRQALW